MILLVVALGYGFLEASATAKIANLVTNLSAIVVFGLSGSVLWALGLTMGVANLVGGYLGARTAIARGSAFVRKVFLVVLTGLIIKLTYDVVVTGTVINCSSPHARSGRPRTGVSSWRWSRSQRCCRSAGVRSTSQSPQEGLQRCLIRMINLRAVAASRGTPTARTPLGGRALR